MFHHLTAVNSSWQNGKVERVHNTLNNWMRAELFEIGYVPGVQELIRIAESCVEVHNTTMSDPNHLSPHCLMFQFPSWIYDNVPELKPRIAKHWFSTVKKKIKRKVRFKFREDDPKPGEKCLV